jgi:Tol biopolymer transport system component
MGCEESAGVAPGRPLEAARRCQSDADCTGFGTGRCVPANLVFGFTSDDEMCIMPGVYYELEAQTGGGQASAFALTQVTRSTDNPATALAEESFTTSVSGDGTRLAFTSSADLVGQNADGSLEVFTADLSTTPPTLRQLTAATGGALASAFPVISNNGSTVAFTSNVDLLKNGTNSDGNPEIFAANFDGSNLRQLTNTPTGTNGPFLSSTGELLNLVGLTINGNGSVVAFTSTAPLGGRSGNSQEVFILGTNGSGLRQLTTGTVGNSANPNLAINGVSITEDGSRIVFSSTGNYTNDNGFQIPQIFTITGDGSGIRQLTTFSQGSCEESGGTLCVGTFVTPTFSDDGSRIGFLRLLVNLDNLTSPKLLNTEPFIMNADGTGRQQLFDAPSAQVNCSPVALSRNGSQASFICTDEAVKQGKLYVNNAAGNALQTVTEAFPNTGLTAPPALSDVGGMIAFAAKANPVGQNGDANAELFVAAQGSGGTAALLENPRSGSTQSGIGIISGWACRANRVEFVIDGVHQLQAVYGTAREDTRATCDDADNGFSLLVNWNLLSNGTHTVVARADGVEFARVTFTMHNLGAEFLTGLSGECTVSNFPQAGTNTSVHWDESLQNFVLGPNQSSSGNTGVNGNNTAKLENPAGGSTHSGIGVVSGWACQAGKVELVVDGTIRLQADYGSRRGDTQLNCNDTNNGFALLVNWNLLPQGAHTLAVVIDGSEVAKVPFTVTNLGTQFLTGVSGECSVPNFPQSGKTTKVRWDEGVQRFGIVGVE